MKENKKLKVISVVPGFGGTFYCGNCLRDKSYVKSLIELGHEAVTLPVYLPLSVEDYNPDKTLPVFYGAVNIYLKQNFNLFRHMPSWLERFFDSPPLLKYAAKKSGSTRASGLEEMTISMLNGSDGNQKDELQQLIDYLKVYGKPDVVHISNALIMGMAKKIREELNIPVVCSLQDEDVWIDAMEEPYRSILWKLLEEKSEDIDAFVAVSDYYASVMKKKMNIPEKKLFVVHVGVDPDNYSYVCPDSNPPVIGYLSRICEVNGFGILVDAFIILKNNPDFRNARLKISGGNTGDDKIFIKKQIKKLEKNNYLNDVEFVKDFRTDVLHDFLKDLTVLSVPVLKGEAFGRYQIESIASGIPVVQPSVGAFPEIVNATGGGVIYNPNTPEALASKLVEVFSDKDNLKKMSNKGRESIINNFTSKQLTKKMIKIYEKL